MVDGHFDPRGAACEFSRPGYCAWLNRLRSAAETWGAKPITKSQLASMGEQYRRWRQAQAGAGEHLLIVDRRPGEIANPITGEIVTECMTIGRLADALTITTDKLTDAMVFLKMVHRVLDHREVPMISQPAARKPIYFLTPKATRYGIEEGFVIPIKAGRDLRLREVLLITPEGQGRLRDAVWRVVVPQSRAKSRRSAIMGLLGVGYCQADIAKMTGIPRQTVSRLVRAGRDGTASLSHFA